MKLKKIISGFDKKFLGLKIADCFTKRWKIFLFLLLVALIICWKIVNILEPNLDENELHFLEYYRENRLYAANLRPLRIVHLDFKGAPPKMIYLKEILPTIVAAGGNALLIEYEDMFPFEGKIKNLSASEPYTKEEIKELLQLCDYYDIEVIPLVQTFGHMEYVLKLEEFRHLREVGDNPQEICPSNPDSLSLIEEMIRQVLKLHQSTKTTKRIHIGCDEVYNINVCPRCMKRSLESRNIFVNHVKNISTLIKKMYPEVIPLIWDDMLRSWPAGFLETTELNKYVEPMIWSYGKDILKLIPHRYWYWYFKHFENIWVAGAFKGATQPLAVLPNVADHYENQKSWLKFISKNNKPNIKIVGYVLTGWSRYDHFASLCELLPVAIPSMVLNLLMISSAFSEKINMVSSYDEILKCRSKNNLQSIIELKNTEACIFPGQELIPLVFQLIYFRKEINFLFECLYETNAWLNENNLKNNYINGRKIRKQFEKYKFHELYNSFARFYETMRVELRKYYKDATVEEWFQEHVELYANKLRILSNSLKISQEVNKWSRRNT